MLFGSLLCHLEVDLTVLLVLIVDFLAAILTFGEDHLLFDSTQLQLTIVFSLEL